MKRPRAASIPPRKAWPYPLAEIGTTRAPNSAAIFWDPSVLPLSATRISPEIPPDSKAKLASRIQPASVRASFRHRLTMMISGLDELGGMEIARAGLGPSQ